MCYCTGFDLVGFVLNHFVYLTYVNVNNVPFSEGMYLGNMSAIERLCNNYNDQSIQINEIMEKTRPETDKSYTLDDNIIHADVSKICSRMGSNYYIIDQFRS